MFEYDSINNTKRSRRYLNDLCLLAAVFFIAFVIWLLIRIFAVKGDVVALSFEPEGSENKQTQYIGLESNGYYVITFDTDQDGIEAMSVEGPYPDEAGIPDDVYCEKSGTYINILEIKDGEADICYADCPDKICVNTEAVSRTGQSIICLPHSLIIYVETDDSESSGGLADEKEPDAVTW